MKNRVEVLHGVNLDMLGRRDPEHYGTVTLRRARGEDQALRRTSSGSRSAFFQTNHEGEFVEHLHRLPELADAAVLNAGAWTHYSYAIRDALEIAAAAGGRGPPLRRPLARGVARATRCSRGWCSGRCRARGPTATARRSRC